MLARSQLLGPICLRLIAISVCVLLPEMGFSLMRVILTPQICRVFYSQTNAAGKQIHL